MHVGLVVVSPLEALGTVKPGQHVIPPQPGWFVRQVRVVRRIGPGPEVLDQAVFLWVLVDVGYQVDKVRIGSDQYPAKGTLEQRASAIIGFVECPGVGIKQVGEALAGFLKT